MMRAMSTSAARKARTAAVTVAPKTKGREKGRGFLGGGDERRQEPEAREEAAEAATARKTTGVLLLRKFNADAERSS